MVVGAAVVGGAGRRVVGGEWWVVGSGTEGAREVDPLGVIDAEQATRKKASRMGFLLTTHHSKVTGFFVALK